MLQVDLLNIEGMRRDDPETFTEASEGVIDHQKHLEHLKKGYSREFSGILVYLAKISK